VIEADNSSAADATVWTLPDASSAAPAAAEDCRVACSATADMLLAVADISVAADATCSTDLVSFPGGEGVDGCVKLP